jgi:tetratricopeptide (TPR) repeat protein
VFPFQWEAEKVLRGAAGANPDDARAWYYLGNLLYDWQPERATAAWERSASIDAGFPIVHRNLAIAYAHSRKPDGRARAIASLEKAVALPGPRYAMHFAELDRLYEETGKAPAERLRLLEANHDVVATRDEALARAISLKVFAGKLDDAIRLLSGRRFSVWEGGTLNVRDPWTNAHVLRGHEHLAARRYPEAIAAYEKALTFPENLTSERLDTSGRRAEVEYWTGVAKQATGDEAGARRAWEAAASTPPRRGAPDGADQQYFEALALRKLGREQTARERLMALLKTATRILEQKTPDRGREAMARYLAGLARVGLGRFKEGLQDLRRALELRPDFLAAKMALDYAPE